VRQALGNPPESPFCKGGLHFGAEVRLAPFTRAFRIPPFEKGGSYQVRQIPWWCHPELARDLQLIPLQIPHCVRNDKRDLSTRTWYQRGFSGFPPRGPVHPHPMPVPLHAELTTAELLARAFPDYAIVSEETRDSPRRLGAERLWIVDPLVTWTVPARAAAWPHQPPVRGGNQVRVFPGVRSAVWYPVICCRPDRPRSHPSPRTAALGKERAGDWLRMVPRRAVRSSTGRTENSGVS
jgi:hypothetical protein